MSASPQAEGRGSVVGSLPSLGGSELSFWEKEGVNGQESWMKVSNLVDKALDARVPCPLTLGSEAKHP